MHITAKALNVVIESLDYSVLQQNTEWPLIKAVVKHFLTLCWHIKTTMPKLLHYLTTQLV